MFFEFGLLHDLCNIVKFYGLMKKQRAGIRFFGQNEMFRIDHKLKKSVFNPWSNRVEERDW